MGDSAIVSGTDLRRVYGEGDAAVHALRGVMLGLPAGRYTAIMGPSGSGESALMHLLVASIGALLGIVLGVAFAAIVSRPLADDGFVLTIPIGTLIAVTMLAALAGSCGHPARPARRARGRPARGHDRVALTGGSGPRTALS